MRVRSGAVWEDIEEGREAGLPRSNECCGKRSAGPTSTTLSSCRYPSVGFVGGIGIGFALRRGCARRYKGVEEEGVSGGEGRGGTGGTGGGVA